jgi:pilus assembly protein FimV
MSPRLNRVWLVGPFLLLAYQAWALGLGDIRLSSALNQPLRAEIELLAATPEELNNLSVQLASQDTFERYDLDRPMFLTGLEFEIVRSGRADGNVVRVTSTDPITEPFLTFLVEANWSRGRLLREYTLLLDPPTFAPPPSTPATETVTAPTRAAPADSGEIRRPAPAPQPQTAPPPPRPSVQPPVQAPAEARPDAPAPQPAPAAPRPAPTPAADTIGQPDFDASPGGDLLVVRGDTLWGITQRVRPDSRLTINQTMLAIYEANPDAFEGNINRLRAGATLRIPSADDIFSIRRADAFAEVRRQNQDWRGETPTVSAPPAPAPVVEPEEAQPSLTLVPPDEEDAVSLSDTSADTGAADVADDVAAEAPVDPGARIQEIEAILDDPAALIAIPDNELAALRQELADLRAEAPPEVDPGIDEVAAEDDLAADDAAAVEDVVEPDETTPEAEAPTVEPAPQVVARRPDEGGIVATILGYLNNFWVWIGTALVVTVAILFWFMRRAARRDDEDATGVWAALDADELDANEIGAEEAASTERLRALATDDESIVVVETESPDEEPAFGGFGDTMADIEDAEPAFAETQQLIPEAAEPEDSIPLEADEPTFDPLAATGTSQSLEDTFSSETAVNLDQSDPVAEADFHMAYGLYDQAADLINGALGADPERQDLLAKLCEIYFVWGNRDGFVDAAMRMKTIVGGESDAEWDKIVIMGQQIAGDHELFSGVSAEGVTKAVDLSFGDDEEEAGGLDIDFASEDADASDVIDLGGEEEDAVIDLGAPGTSKDEINTDETGQVLIPPDSGSGIDFSLGDDTPNLEASATREMLAADEEVDEFEPGETTQVASDTSAQTPTIEQQFDMEATGELPAFSETPTSDDLESPAVLSDATAEIDLDDLGLDLDSLGDTGLAADDDELLGESDDAIVADDQLDVTGRNEALPDADDLDATGRIEALDAGELDSTSTREGLDIESDIEATSMQEALDATGIQSALEATGDLPDLDASDDTTGISKALSDDEATQFASLDDDATEFAPLDDESGDTGFDLDSSLLDATGRTQVLTEDMAVQTAADIDANISDSDATTLAPGVGGEGSDSTISDEAATMLAPMDEDEDEGGGDFDFAKTEALPKDVFSPDMSTDDTGRMPGLAGSTDMDLDLDDLTAALKVSEVGDTINQLRDDATVQQPRIRPDAADDDIDATGVTQSLAPEDISGDLHDARTMTEVGTKLDLARAYVDMGDPAGAKSILEEVLDEGDAGQKQQAQQLIDSLPT